MGSWLLASATCLMFDWLFGSHRGCCRRTKLVSLFEGEHAGHHLGRIWFERCRSVSSCLWRSLIDASKHHGWRCCWRLIYWTSFSFVIHLCSLTSSNSFAFLGSELICVNSSKAGFSHRRSFHAWFCNHWASRYSTVSPVHLVLFRYSLPLKKDHWHSMTTKETCFLVHYFNFVKRSCHWLLRIHRRFCLQKLWVSFSISLLNQKSTTH